MTVTGEPVGLHPAVDRVLAGWPADVGSRAAAALRVMLGGRAAADGTAAWTSSRLTGDGFPVEVGFATGDDDLRLTVEPGGIHLDPWRRLDVTLGVLAELNCPAVPAPTLAECRRLQVGGLRYGTWLGCRIRAAQSGYKLYVEVADGAEPPSGLVAPKREAQLRMVGCVPGSGVWETYFRIRDLDPLELAGVLAPAGFGGRAAELREALAEAYGHRLGERLPGRSVGVSYGFSAAGEPVGVTLFLFARAFWGPDARIRARFGAEARALGWDDVRYQAVTAPLSARRDGRTAHGILGFTLLPGGRRALSMGVRPPC